MPGGDENRGKESRKETGGKIKKKERKETKKGKNGVRLGTCFGQERRRDRRRKAQR